MISQRLQKMLIEQVGSELSAHSLYMGMSIYFERQSLSRWAKLFRSQSMEEAGHAEKIMQFLVDNDIVFDMPALKSAKTRYNSALDAAKATLASEQRVTGQFQAMATAALEEADHTSFEFLQWFIEEQVEEERKAQGLIDLIDSGINLFQAEPLLDSFE